MAATKEEIIEALKEMTLLEASELVKMIEETFGVSAAAPVAVAAGPAAAAKAVTEFAKENKKLEVKGGMMDGAFVGAEDVKAIASLPSKEVLIAQIAGAISGVARGLAVCINGVPSGLARAIQQIADQKAA